MQTVASNHTEYAKKTTRQEFIEIMQKLIAMAREAMAERGLPARFSYDNNRIQQTASLRQLGLQECEKVPLGPYMPDCHKVIEHVFAQLKPIVTKELYAQTGMTYLTSAIAQSLVKDCFFTKITQEQIARDALTNPVTYFVVKTDQDRMELGPDGMYHKGTGGDWPMSGDR
jgi:hypothetical protein